MARRRLVLSPFLTPHTMSTDLATRRPIRKLSRADLAAFPVWEWAIDDDDNPGQDASFVRPTPHEAVPVTAARDYLVAATATLNDGSTLPACVEVSQRDSKPVLEPLFVILMDRHLDFAGAESTAVLSRYTKRMNTYPVRWELVLPLEGESGRRHGRVRRSLALRLSQLWLRLRLAAGGNSVVVP